MTDDQIIAVAKVVRNGGHWDQLDIINFGRLIAAAERERIGDQCAEQIKAAIEDEREACAKVCENEGARIDASWTSCAAAIRARGQA